MRTRTGLSSVFTIAVSAWALLSAPSPASATLIDLNGPLTGILIGHPGLQTGILIGAPGGSFAQTFAGQTVTVDGTGISGTPGSPLMLQGSGRLNVQGSLDAPLLIHSFPGEQGPLSVLLDTPATSITWTIASLGTLPSDVDIALFDANGSLVESLNRQFFSQNQVSTVDGFGTFSGVTFFNNSNPGGLRFSNFSYEAVPEPSTVLLLSCGLAALAVRRRR